jgi:hypothetical protein
VAPDGSLAVVDRSRQRVIRLDAAGSLLACQNQVRRDEVLRASQFDAAIVCRRDSLMPLNGSNKRSLSNSIEVQ